MKICHEIAKTGSVYWLHLVNMDTTGTCYSVRIIWLI